MRIITGKKRGMKLISPEGYDTRPTTEFAKEAVFNILGTEIEGAVFLDLFAGSGQMGLEALSRGAKAAYLCDSSPEAVKTIEANVKKSGLDATVYRGDYIETLKKIRDVSIDIIYLDPPFKKKMIFEALSNIEKHLDISKTKYIITEDETDREYSLSGYIQRKKTKYGRIYITVLEREIQ